MVSTCPPETAFRQTVQQQSAKGRDGHDTSTTPSGPLPWKETPLSWSRPASAFDQFFREMMSKSRPTRTRPSTGSPDRRGPWKWAAALVVAAVAALSIAGLIPGTSKGRSGSGSSNRFLPTVENKTAPSSPAPEGMVWIPGGEFSMGSDIADEALCGLPGVTRDAQPIHRVYVDGFWMDRTEVTNEQFDRFVRATGYVTIAERTPTQEEFPTAPPENLVAGSTVFTPTPNPVPLNNHFQWWRYEPGANWHHPEGPASNLAGREKYPVVHIAYDDALAYAKWAHKRLPTEAEWEFAARGGEAGQLYPWGNDLKPAGKWMANIYEGTFPVQDTGEDGFAGLAPVAQFPPNHYGLYDVAGNVWEWCSDWYRPDYYVQLAEAGRVALNPAGPASPLDPAEPGEKKRVHRGGSFLCTDQYCSRYMTGTRGKGEITTGSNHLGFRCVRSETTSAN
jgi:formylglycine-generating enzyme required for sulfatase activity